MYPSSVFAIHLYEDISKQLLLNIKTLNPIINYYG